MVLVPLHLKSSCSCHVDISELWPQIQCFKSSPHLRSSHSHHVDTWELQP